MHLGDIPITSKEFLGIIHRPYKGQDKMCVLCVSWVRKEEVNLVGRS